MLISFASLGIWRKIGQRAAQEAAPQIRKEEEDAEEAASQGGRAARLPVGALVERFDIEPSLIFQPNEQPLVGSFSSVSTPNFARKYSLESF